MALARTCCRLAGRSEGAELLLELSFFILPSIEMGCIYAFSRGRFAARETIAVGGSGLFASGCGGARSLVGFEPIDRTSEGEPEFEQVLLLAVDPSVELDEREGAAEQFGQD